MSAVFEDKPDYVALRTDLAEICAAYERGIHNVLQLEDLEQALGCAQKHAQGLLGD